MSTKILDGRKLKRLQPATLLWRRYAPASAPWRFRARTQAAARRWQARVRPLVRTAVGFADLPPAPLAPRRIEVVDRGDYRREKILLRTSRDSVMPVYLLLPKAGRRPLPVVIAFHGHGYGVKDIVGLWEDGAERATPDGYHKDFAVALCRRGFAVAAPEISCFGERQTDYSALPTAIGAPVPTTCQQTAALAMHLGGTALGLRLHDARRLVDYLATRDELDPRRLGAMGISGGGLHTLFSAALDTRIRAAVVSGYFTHWRDSILAMHHCPCNFVPGLHRLGEIHDLAGLVAPRPLLVENASHDPIFPIASARRAVRQAREVYRVFGAPATAVATDFFEGRHAISGRRAYDFLWDHLAG